jgi:CelD/BcsL family acetyltransferase involved in cellulose biosynthesis
MRAAAPHAAEAAQAFSLSGVPPAGWDDAALRRRWEEIVGGADQANAVYASPVWFDHLRRTTPERELLLFVARDERGETVGVVPVRVEREELLFDVASRALFRRRLKVANVLGSVPLLPEDRALYARLCETLLDPRLGCDAIYLDTAPVESAFRRFAAEGAGALGLLTYFPYGARPWHLVRFPAREEEYFSQLKAKQRSELKRRTKKLSEHCGGQLELVRVEGVGEVEAFVADAAKVSRNSWQHEVIGTRVADSVEQSARLRSMAEGGLLRSYLLRCGERPCAFALGYQHGDTYHGVEIGYDRDFTHLSPGMVLYHLLVGDLFSHRTPTLLNFGRGDADYKQRFGNVRREDVSIFLMRRTPLNRLSVGGHRAFRSLVSAARATVRRLKRA